MQKSDKIVLIGGVIAAGVAALIVAALLMPPAAPVTSNPEVVFEPEPVMKCVKVGSTGPQAMIRCTDTERDVTCYAIRGNGADPLSCLPNQWLNYPASIGNVNDPIAQ